MALHPKRASFYADLDLLQTHFEALDKDTTGYIGYSELTQLVRDMPTFEDSMVPELMERLDRDKDGRISFEDFTALFELEREAAKHASGVPQLGLSPSHFSTPNQTHYDTAFESTPSEIIVSPTDSDRRGKQKGDDFPDSPTVILRHRRLGRRSLPANFKREPKAPDFLSPIRPEADRGPSGDMPDLATQMRYLTAAESPQLNRTNSKVLSWISESEDMLFEDTGTGAGEERGVSSPPLSPTRGGSDEASHVRSILKGVCNSQEIGRDAIAKLCSHVQADAQEERALLSLLDSLDQRRQGWVPLDDFVRALQGVRNAAIVASMPSPHFHALQRRRYSDMTPPVLSEPFDSPLPSKEPPLASTPLPASAVAEERAILSVLDPEHSGYVKVDSLVSKLQKMGVEAPHNQSLEEVLAEAIPMDPSGRVSLVDLTASLEGAMLGEGKTQSVLRQVALKSFKNEISLLRSQMHQVSLERDTLKTSLVRTQEENKMLVIEGDEHVDLVSQQSQRIIKEQETRHSVRLREVERSRLEEAQLFQERASQQVSKLQHSLDTVKQEEEKLREDFRYAQDQVHEATEKLSHAHRELAQKDRIIRSLHKDLSIRSDQGYGDDIVSQLPRISELENEISERAAQNQELSEKTRELLDRVDLLMADNEEWKQKYTAQKRKLQRRRSSGSLKQSEHQSSLSRRRRPSSGRLSSGGERQSVPQRPRSAGFRPPVSIPRRLPRARTPPPILEDLEELDIPEDTEAQSSEPDSPIMPAEVESNFLPEDMESSESTAEGSSSSDGLFVRSTASLMEEFQKEEHRTMLQRRIDQLRRDKEKLELDCQDLEQQLRSLEEENQPTQMDDLHKELTSKRKKQAEIEKHIANLDRQQKRLSASRIEIDSQLANAEDSIAQQLEEIRSLKKLLVVSGDLESGSDVNLDHLMEELEQTKVQMEEDQSSHKETVEKLLQEIKTLEDERAIHLDHSQRVDSEYGQLQEQVSSLQDKLQLERAIHEEELNKFKQQIQDSQNLLTEAKDRYDTEVSAARKEVDSVQVELAQYRENVDTLTSKLREAEVALEGSLARRHETAELQAQPPSENPKESIAAKIGMLTSALEQSQEEIARYSELNANLENQLQLYEATTEAARERAEEEVARLQSQLIAVHTEISDQATLYEEEISQLKEDHKIQADKAKKLAEIRLTESKEEYEKVAHSLKHRCELQVETVQHELKGSQLRMKELQEKLLATEGECEAALTEVSQLRERQAQTLQQLTEYQANEKWYNSEMSLLKTDAERYRDELASMKVKEEQYQSQVAVLVDELQNRTAQQSPAEAVAVDESDFGVLQMSPPHRPSSRTSYKSDTSMHEETLTHMKSQLEDLQKLLMVPGKLREEEGGNEELSLIQELIATNSTLQNEMQKSQQNFQSEQQRYQGELEAVNQELKASALRIQALQTKLSNSEIQCENALMEATQLRDRGASDHLQIVDYQASEKRYKSEISQLKMNAEKQKDELAALKDKEQEYQNRIAVIAGELRSTAVQESPERTPTHPQASRSPYKADVSMHEETVAQMKSQLENLQMLLITQRESGGEEGDSEELSLVQELLASNSALQSDMWKAQQRFQSEEQRDLSSTASKEKTTKPEEETTETEASRTDTSTQSIPSLVTSTLAGKEREIQLRDQSIKRKDEEIQVLKEELERAKLLTKASRSPYKADDSMHEETVTHMKSQLENLQMLLVTRKESSGEEGNSEELSLVQELLASNSALQSDMWKAQQRFQTEQERYLSSTASKEEVLEQLRSEISKQKHAETLVTQFAEHLLREMQSLQERSSRVLNGYSTRIGNAVSKVTTVEHTLGDRNQKHTGTVESLLSELDASKSALGSFRSEVGMLRSSLEKTQEDLNRSQSDMVDLQHAKEAEVERLKQEMDSLRKELSVSKPPPATATAIAVTTTELEAQVTSTGLETQTESEAGEEGAEIELKGQVQALKDEIEQRNNSEKKLQSSLEVMEAEVYSLSNQLARMKNKETEAPRTDTSTQSIPSPVTSTLAGKEREIQLRDRAIKRKDEEIQVLKEELERAELSKRAAEDAQASAAAEVQKLQDELRKEQAVTATLASRKPALEDRAEPKEKAFSDKARLEIKRRDEIIARKNEDIRNMTAEIEKANASMTDSIYAQELAEADIKRKHNELQQQGRKLSAYEQQISELQCKLEAVVSEPVEAVIQYVEAAPLESVNEAVFVELQHDIQAERAKVRDLESSAQQLQSKLDDSVPDYPEESEQLVSLREAVQQAEEELKASQAAQEDLRRTQVQLMEELREEHAQKLSAAQLVAETQTEELRELHAALISPLEGDSYRQPLDHLTMVQEINAEVESLKAQLHHAQVMSAELEKTLVEKIQEHDQQELQFHTEHEEEVMALHQQKQQLAKQMDELKKHYHKLLNDQDNQNTVLLEDLVSRKAHLENQLQQKADDHFKSYQQVTDLLEEKKVLLAIIRQLCVEAEKEIEVG